MAPPQVSKDPFNKTSIQIFTLVLTLRWKQDQGMFELNGKRLKDKNQVLNN
jgi:hypothetical protein